ncbi:bacteriocin [Flavobacterium denitrificans]|nr:bacteriocin [Flavobacterium denitrificans]
MNLEELNLVELKAHEMEEIEGGFLLELLAGILVGAIAYLLTT